MILFQNIKAAVFLAFGILGGVITSEKNSKPSAEKEFPTPPHTDKTLFYIQRSPNTNTVMYEANVKPDKTIDLENPVDVYWIRYAEKGQRKKLNYIERVLAYGVNCTPSNAHSCVLRFNASKSRQVMVLIDAQGRAHAHMAIGKKNSQLEKIFVTVTEGGWLPKVNFVEFFGTDLVSGEKTYEKMMI